MRIIKQADLICMWNILVWVCVLTLFALYVNTWLPFSGEWTSACNMLHLNTPILTLESGICHLEQAMQFSLGLSSWNLDEDLICYRYELILSGISTKSNLQYLHHYNGEKKSLSHVTGWQPNLLHALSLAPAQQISMQWLALLVYAP